MAWIADDRVVEDRLISIQSMAPMNSIDHFNLRSFDLNLLVAFDALMIEGNVTGAAKRLKIGQPAMSHALATLRLLMDDQLFVRTGRTMRPSAKARRMAPPVRHILLQAQQILQREAPFDPSTERRTFRVAMSSEMEALLLPELGAQLGRASEAVRVRPEPIPEQGSRVSLLDGTLDMIIGCDYPEHGGVHVEKLFDVQAVCCFNPRLLDLQMPVSRDAYLASHHVMASRNEYLQKFISEALELAGFELNVEMQPQTFIAALAACQVRPLVATVARQVAERFAKVQGLSVSPLPVALQLPPVTMVWMTQMDKDPANLWLREQVRTACRASFRI